MLAMRYGLVSVVLCALVSAPSWAVDAPAAGPTTVFERDIRPILKANCFRCHGGEEESKGGLDLRLRRFMVTGGDSGAAIEPGKRDESLLFERVRSGEMPPTDRKLSSDEVARIGAWIDQGAPTTAAEPEKLDPGLEITPEERAFWSFQPIPAAVPIPAFSSADRVRTPIDAFLAQSLHGKNLAFSADADKRVLLIRAYLDLIGIPPTREELASFLADSGFGVL